eukprot:Gregarina_sp_Poly_1__4627@NODE_2475_length_2076_cov_29_483823_g1568_i0_p1_GENE_NODE_2475_length_2076_cov_29_483823_g1568_i0NODE_2475_length_2076_cov_29_483823_g1568_i0_p1_ORF_typecomplete_len613_score86_61Pro_isomerase/PF00160_21/2_2e59ANAPC4_WD40/PF12894_7/0_0043ANAPC4_WD40/PF12894_7/1_8e03ANAPC4_WD40/PF12894_7/0_00017ANAPC4_WD40/PF12894_7/68WD40/PF00400_32/0_54WD40/PF00400_32/0_0026WD40/PF00400_32/1_6e04WD40/PF00400_32/1_7e02WD40/PF00400_32/7_1e02Ge1_WD40/PF16529_5/0_017Ge1_WD40/PF16529_5/0_31
MSTEPSKKRKVATASKRSLVAEAALKVLPQSETYAVSFQHKKTISHVLISDPCDFVVTLSHDGAIKFWKRRASNVEFVKSYRAHLSAIRDAAISKDGSTVATIGEGDRSVKIFNVVDFDLLCKHDLDFDPAAVGLVHLEGVGDLHLAVSDTESRNVWFFAAMAPSTKRVKFLRHLGVVHLMTPHSSGKFIISTDMKGGIEYWIPNAHSNFPSATEASTSGYLRFNLKSETDLFELQKKNTHALAMAVSPSGLQLALLCRDGLLRIFAVSTGKLLTIIDETVAALKMSNVEQLPDFAKLSELEFERRCAMEEEYWISNTAFKSSVHFDPSGCFLLYSSMLGIKIIDASSFELVGVIGRHESGLRYTCFGLSFGGSKMLGMDITTGMATGPKEGAIETLLIAGAHKRNRFFVFNQSPNTPDESRDVKNEVEDATHKTAPTTGPQMTTEDGVWRLSKNAVIHTTYGDIRLRLFPDECPRAVENFCVHAQRGYYDGVIFHRVIRGFMVQTGDPLGNGTGGQSIWGTEFEDEFCSTLNHDEPGVLSMANAGPNTNGSQFFITTVPTPFLNGKHTVFGKVERGLDVVKDIEQVKTNVEDRPIKDIKIISIKIMQPPAG